MAVSVYAETTKTKFNPFTGKLDFITTLSSTTLPSGSTQYIQNTGNPTTTTQVFNVSSGTILGPLRITGAFLTQQASEGTSLEFDPSGTTLAINKQSGGPDSGTLSFQTLGSERSYFKADSASWDIGVSTMGGTGTGRISLSNQASTNARIIFNQSNFGFTLRESSMTFDSGSDDPVIDWSADGIYRLANGTFTVTEVMDVPGDFKRTTNTAGFIMVGDGYDYKTVDVSGDVDLTASGSFTIQDNSVDGTDIAFGSDAQGDVNYYDGTNWVRLGAGTSGQKLETRGAGANPVWDDDETGGGGGSAAIFTTSGTSGGFINTISSPTGGIVAHQDQFILTKTGGTTSFWEANPSSITLQGQNVVTTSSIAATSYLPTSVAAAAYILKSSQTIVYSDSAQTITGAKTVTTSSWTFAGASTVAVARNGLILLDSDGSNHAGIRGAQTIATNHYTVWPSSVAEAVGQTLEVVSISGSTQTTVWGNDASGGAAAASTGTISLLPQSAKLTGTYVTATITNLDVAYSSAAIDGGSGPWKILFDAANDEAAVWSFTIPQDWTGHVYLDVVYSMASATTLEVEWEGSIQCVTPGDAADIDTESFADGASSGGNTVPGTAGHTDISNITITDDSCAAGDNMYVYISCDSNDSVNDDATSDRELLSVSYRYLK